MGNKPFLKLRTNGVEIALWDNENGVITGTVEKRYFNREEGRWADSSNFSAGDLIILSKLAEQAALAILNISLKGNQEVEELSTAERLRRKYSSNRPTNDEELPF